MACFNFLFNSVQDKICSNVKKGEFIENWEMIPKASGDWKEALFCDLYLLVCENVLHLEQVLI